MPIRPATPNTGDRQGLFFVERNLTFTSMSITSGTMRVAYKTAPVTKSYAKVRLFAGGTAAGATPTLVRMGIYSVADDGSLTALLGSTVNDTAIFGSANVAYSRDLSAPVTLVAGRRYAFAVLVVTAAATPTIRGITLFDAGEAGVADRISSQVAGLADLPASVAVGSIVDSAGQPYGVLTN